MTKECTTHHHACDCREAKLRKMEQELVELRGRIQSALDVFNDRAKEVRGFQNKTASDMKAALLHG